MGGPGAALLSPPAEFLRTSPWNLAILCDLPLNPGHLGTGLLPAGLALSTLHPFVYNINLPIWAQSEAGSNPHRR